MGKKCGKFQNLVKIVHIQSVVIYLAKLNIFPLFPDAADFYIKKENLFVLHEDQKVHLAINRLGLTTLSAFNPTERIIEYCLPSEDGPLISRTVKDLVQEVAARSSAPGGGSVSALVASLVC